MAHDDMPPSDRRTFLQAGALVAATAAGVTPCTAPGSRRSFAGHPSQAAPRQDRRRDLAAGHRHRAGARRGPPAPLRIRPGDPRFDTSAAYQSEPDFKAWFQQEPAVRKEVFIVTKEHEAPGIASQLPRMIDEHCGAMGTDCIDLFFVHSFGDNGIDASLKLLKSKELKVAAERPRSRERSSCLDCRPTTGTGP